MGSVLFATPSWLTDSVAKATTTNNNKGLVNGYWFELIRIDYTILVKQRVGWVVLCYTIIVNDL
jgi:hypothetical protein